MQLDHWEDGNKRKDGGVVWVKGVGIEEDLECFRYEEQMAEDRKRWRQLTHEL